MPLPAIRAFGNEVTFGALPYAATVPMMGIDRLSGGNMTWRQALDATQGVMQQDEASPMSVLAGQTAAAMTPMGFLKKAGKTGAKAAAKGLSDKENDFLYSAIQKYGVDGPDVAGALDFVSPETLKKWAVEIKNPETKKALSNLYVKRKFQSPNDRQADILTRQMAERDKFDAASDQMVNFALGRGNTYREGSEALAALPKYRQDGVSLANMAGNDASVMLAEGMSPKRIVEIIGDTYGSDNNPFLGIIGDLDNPDISKVQRTKNAQRMADAGIQEMERRGSPLLRRK